MCVRVSDELPDIRAAWERLESIVPLQGRKFFGGVEGGTAYLACAERNEGDDPDALGLESIVLPGGRYLRERLRGEPPDVYDEIAPTVPDARRAGGARRDPAQHRVLPPACRERS